MELIDAMGAAIRPRLAKVFIGVVKDADPPNKNIHERFEERTGTILACSQTSRAGQQQKIDTGKKPNQGYRATGL
eukprot:2953279-Pyramimonas_sp.AAC.1